MTWHYSGDPSSSAKDQVRFLIGDTDTKDQLLLDKEIEFVLSQHNNAPLNAAISCCERIMAKFGRMADESVGQVKISFSQKVTGWQKILSMLKTRLATNDATPYAGGISVSDKQAQRLNSDLVRPDFTKHMMENSQIAPWTQLSQFDLWNQFE